MLSFSTFKERSSYWSELLHLFWIRQLGCKSAFCIVKQVTRQSPKKREFTPHLDLDASVIESHYIYEVLTISHEEMENYYKDFTSFLKSLNKKQFIYFCSENKYYISLIMRIVSGIPFLANIRVTTIPDLEV